jgi:hypothetical protein
MDSTHIDQLFRSQRTFLEAVVKVVDMISQELINSGHLCQILLQLLPIGFQNVAGDKTQHVLHPLQHLRSQNVDASLPSLNIGRAC